MLPLVVALERLEVVAAVEAQAVALVETLDPVLVAPAQQVKETMVETASILIMVEAVVVALERLEQTSQL
jgi:hypothetical protein